MGRGLVGIDVGTSATRVSLLDEDGAVVAAATAAHPGLGAGDEDEQDAARWLEGLAEALAEALGSCAARQLAPRAVGICGQTPTLVLADAAGEPVRPALTWQDTRAVAEAAELAERLGDPEPLIGTALAWSPANMPAKLLWLARHEPPSVAATRWLLQPKDLVGMALTGSPLSDPWSSKGICRVTDGSPAREVLAACGWPEAACPPTGAPWAARGRVSEAAASRFGLPAGVPVSVGWSDALAEVLAAGCFTRRSGFFFSGTSAIVGAPVEDEGARAPGMFRVPTSCAPAPLLYGPTQSSGAALAWGARLLGCRLDELATLAAGARGECPAFVPYLTGERAPLWDERLRAVLVGLGAGHGRAEVARAVVEGVLLSARHLLSVVEGATGRPVGEVEVVARGVGDPAFEALALACLAAPLRLHEDAEMSARGAAMLGAMAAGGEMGEVVSRLGGPSRVARPAPAHLTGAPARLGRYLSASEVARAWRRGAEGR